ncbi:hypothetical protein TNCV_4765621 [Trichonephila clavipes]|nr:hypothetical protein TNCV_4765621 [Trichonephila clavipes]
MSFYNQDTVHQGYEFRNDLYVDGRSFHWTSLLKSPHLPLSFSLSMLYPFASYLQPILCTGTVALNVLSLVHLVMFHLDISAEMHLSRGNEILYRNKIQRWLFFVLGKTQCTSRSAQLTSILKLMPDTFKTSYDGFPVAF